MYMPKGTRVGRCVDYLKHKYGYGAAIGICQKSTKQHYMTGKKIKKTRKKRGRKRLKKTRRNKKSRKIKGGKWSRKYKRRINCKKPKGFSQKQYCKYGRKKTRVKRGGMEEGYIYVADNKFWFDPVAVDENGEISEYLMYKFNKNLYEDCLDRPGASREYCEEEEAWEPYLDEETGEHFRVSREMYKNLINTYQAS